MSALATERPIASLDEIAERLERALAASPADETELVWLEAMRGHAQVLDNRRDARRGPERTVLVRVVDRGRVGSHRTGGGGAGDLDNAIRAAIAQSRVREPLPGLPHLPPAEGEPAALGGLCDPAVAALDGDGVEPWLGRLRRQRERAELRWTDARVAVFSSRGLRRSARVTAAELLVSLGRRAGAGRAGQAARGLAGLDAEAVFERARERHGGGAVAELGGPPAAAVLSPAATIALCDLLNRVAFSAIAYYDGSSFLREHLGVQVFDRAFSLVDDATDPAGLPFPFDLEGTPKHRVALIDRGTPRTPALDQRQAAVLGLPPTGHAIAGADARAEHLFVPAGTASRDELLAAADGGLWVGWIEPLECFEPTRVLVRAVLRGVRRVRAGRLAEALPDLVWEAGLLRAFSSLLAVGRERTRRLSADGYLGGMTAPSIAVGVAAGELTARR